MKLQNFILFLPKVFSTVILKTVRVNLDKEISEYIVQNGLYHVVPNPKVAKQIINSGEIRASKNIINSYGTPVACMFAGIPELENYMKNLMNGAYDNPLLHPEKVIYVIKINPKAEEISNFKIRVQDQAILHEGSCIIPSERTEIKQLIIDVTKDEFGKEKLAFRERTLEEIARDTDIVEINGYKICIPGGPIPRNIPSNECLRAIQSEKERTGYFKKDILEIGNTLNTYNHILDIEGENTKSNGLNFFKSTVNKIKNRNIKQLLETKKQKIDRSIKEIENGQMDTKKAVRSRKYVDTIISLNKKQIFQKNMSTVLSEILKTSSCEYLQEKRENIDKTIIRKNGIHGIDHSDRVALLGITLLENSGIRLDEKMLDIYLTAAYYHDIGRILPVGPHANRSAKLLDKINLTYLDGKQYTKEDIDILKVLVEAHEGNENKTDKCLKKYHISDENMDITKLLLDTLKDADALDRARLSTKGIMDLEPQYLRLPVAKELIDFSFQLETLTRKVHDFDSILKYDKNLEIEKNSLMQKKQEFREQLQKQNVLDLDEKPIRIAQSPKKEIEKDRKR